MLAGVFDGALEGMVDGVFNGVFDGVRDGVLEDVVDGVLDGVLEDVVDGVLDGVVDRALDFVSDDVEDMILNGATEYMAKVAVKAWLSAHCAKSIQNIKTASLGKPWRSRRAPLAREEPVMLAMRL